jgi:hypothetical protein
MAIFSFFLSPLGRWIAGALAIAALLGGIYFKGVLDNKAAEEAKRNAESLNNLRNRAETNEQVNKLPAPDLDGELNRWVLPDQQ